MSSRLCPLLRLPLDDCFITRMTRLHIAPMTLLMLMLLLVSLAECKKLFRSQERAMLQLGVPQSSINKMTSLGVGPHTSKSQIRARVSVLKRRLKSFNSKLSLCDASQYNTCSDGSTPGQVAGQVTNGCGPVSNPAFSNFLNFVAPQFFETCEQHDRCFGKCHVGLLFLVPT